MNTPHRGTLATLTITLFSTAIGGCEAASGPLAADFGAPAQSEESSHEASSSPALSTTPSDASPAPASASAPAECDGPVVTSLVTGIDATDVALVGEWLYIAGQSASGSWLERCSVGTCSKTRAAVALPPGLTSALRLTSTPAGHAFLFGRGDELFDLTPSAAEPASLGDVLATYRQSHTLSDVYGGPEHVLLAGRRPANHGDWREVALVATGATGAAAPMKVFDGGEINGADGFATPTRSFLVGSSMYGGDLSYVDPSSGNATTYLAGERYPSTQLASPLRAFAFGERVGAIETVEANGTSFVRTALCEGDTTCATPTRWAAPSLPNDSRLYAGAFGDQLVFWMSDPAAATGTIARCTKQQLLDGPCVPSILACNAPRPRGLTGGGFRASGDVASIFYVTEQGSVVRIDR